MWTVIRISSSSFALGQHLAMLPMELLLRVCFSIAMGDMEGFFGVNPVSEMLDWFGDFSYHFLRLSGR